MNMDEVNEWKEFNERFRVSMAGFESDLSQIHSNHCEAKIHKCKLCMAKAKVVVLAEEIKKARCRDGKSKKDD